MDELKIEPLMNPIDAEIASYMDMIFPRELNSPNLYRILAKNEPLFKELIEGKIIGRTGVFDKKRLSPYLREMIILRVCSLTGNRYEFSLHEQTISERMGLSRQQIEDLKKNNLTPYLWNGSELALFDFIQQVLEGKKIKNTIGNYFKESEILDITLLIGFYVTVSYLVRIAQPEIDQYTL